MPAEGGAAGDFRTLPEAMLNDPGVRLSKIAVAAVRELFNPETLGGPAAAAPVAAPASACSPP
jgi:hypothetical protein